jgi:hypothetical protein
MGGADPPRRTLYVGAPGNPPCIRGPRTFNIGRIHTRQCMRHPRGLPANPRGMRVASSRLISFCRSYGIEKV